MIRILLLSTLGPFGFLASIVALSILFSIRLQTDDPDLISKLVIDHLAWVLLMTQLSLVAVLLYLYHRQEFRLAKPRSKDKSWLLGVLLGFIIFTAYPSFLEPILVRLQTLWDYIPPGSVVSRISAPIGIFFVANCMIAPIAEEVFYRAWLLPQLSKRMSPGSSVLLASLLFGLLHWGGGLWYILLTTIVIGVPFSILVIRRKNIIIPLAAHFTINLLEFGYALHLDRMG